MALVCHCRRVNDQVLHTAALATGGDLAETQAICGAGTECGGCFARVLELVDAVRRVEAGATIASVA